MLQQLARKLLKDLNHAGVIIDPSGRIVEANDEFKRCFYDYDTVSNATPGPCKAFSDIIPALDKTSETHPDMEIPLIHHQGGAYRLDVYYLDKASQQKGLRLVLAIPVTPWPPSEPEAPPADEPREKLSSKFSALIGQDILFIQALHLAQRAAQTDLPVLILGESGTGKEILARTIHQASRRTKKPFVDVNCAAIPDSLVESELFGYEKGAFTGASTTGKTGFFENAHQGSIFMDEIGDAAPQTQAKLLRVLESGQFKRIGGNRNIGVDVRLIAATNQELSHRIAEGRFRADLLYRINTITIKLSPLRERLLDLPLLAEHFLESASRDRKGKLKFSKEIMAVLCSYDWPGNVRELKGVIDYAVTMATGSIISPKALPSFLAPHMTSPKPMPPSVTRPTQPVESVAPQTDLLLPVVEKVEREHIRRVLADSGTRSEAIRRLGISRRTFYTKLKQYGLE